MIEICILVFVVCLRNKKNELIGYNLYLQNDVMISFDVRRKLDVIYLLPYARML